MKIDVQSALKYVFQDPNWPKKVLVIVGLQVGVSIISQILQVGSSFSGYLTELFPDLSDTSELFIQLITASIPLIIQFAAGLITIPLQFYVLGYFMENRINVMNSVENPLPENKNIMQKIYLGVMVMLISSAPVLLFMMLMVIPLLVPILLLAFSGENNEGLFLFSFLILFLFIFIIFALSFVLSLLVIPAMLYVYITEGSFRAAFSYSKVSGLLRVYWKNFLLTGLLIFALSAGASMLMFPLLFFTCGFGVFLLPFITIYINSIESHIWGQQYRELKRGEVS